MRFKPLWRHRRRLSLPVTSVPSSVGNFSGDMLSSEFSSFLFRRFLAVAVFLSTLGLSAFVLHRAAGSFGLRLPSYSAALRIVVFPSVPEAPPDSDDKSLGRVLKDASMPDKTVILTTLNEAWAVPNSILDLFLVSFKLGEGTSRLLNHLVIIALDQKAYDRCLIVHTHCFALVTEGIDFSSEAYFMTPDYLKMMWRRIEFLRSVLELGYNFIFTDGDIMWLRDPFPHFYPDADFQIACDRFLGNSSDVENEPNGGFNFVRSSNRTIEFYKFWYDAREIYPGLHDQDVFNNIKHDPFITAIGLKMRFLNTSYFGGFCEPSKDLNEVCTMHANCCFGLDSKLHDLKILLEDWKQFMSLPPVIKRSSLLSWRVPQNCSLDSPRRFELPSMEEED